MSARAAQSGVSHEEVAAFIRNLQQSMDALAHRLIETTLKSFPSTKREHLPALKSSQRQALVAWQAEQLREWDRVFPPPTTSQVIGGSHAAAAACLGGCHRRTRWAFTPCLLPLPRRRAPLVLCRVRRSGSPRTAPTSGPSRPGWRQWGGSLPWEAPSCHG